MERERIMSKQDKRQLVVIYSLVAVVAFISLLVWSGVFGVPKYQKDDKTSLNVTNWMTGDISVGGYVPAKTGLFPNGVPASGVNQTNEIGLGGFGVTSTLVGSSDQSSSFDGNFTQTNNPQF